MSNVVYSSSPAFTSHKTANVYIQPNRYCNYSCSYCFPNSHTKVKDFVDTDKLYKTIDDLCEKFTDRGIEKIGWGWSGGEPTFHPDFLNFQKRILSHTNLKHNFNMTSNISHNLSWWKNFVEVTDGYEIRNISASLHQEFVDTPEKVEKFKEKIAYLKTARDRKKFGVIINQVMDMDLFDDQLETLEEIYNTLEVSIRPKVNSVLLKEHRRYGNTDGYDSAQMKIMSDVYKKDTWRRKIQAIQISDEGKITTFKDNEELKLNGFWSTLQDWNCTAGYLSVAIDRNVIKRGVGACKDQIIGTVGEDFDLHETPRVCGIRDKAVCSCVADLKLPKWKEEFDIKSFLEKEEHDPIGRK